MVVVEVPVSQIDLSESNVRKLLDDGEVDSSIADLANSIEQRGLISPIIVFKKPDGRYSLIAGQRRLLAIKMLGRDTVAANVRDSMSEGEATAVSLVENVHRADMNPRDKAIAFKALLGEFKTLPKVSKETGVTVATIKKYIQLLELAPELQEKLAAGEATATTALAKLAQTVNDPGLQVQVYDRIGGFTQEVQTQILRQVSPDLDNLDDLVDQAHEGAFDVKIVRNCPWDCTNVPAALKQQVSDLLKAYGGGSRQN